MRIFPINIAALRQRYVQITNVQSSQKIMKKKIVLFLIMIKQVLLLKHVMHLYDYII